MWQMKYFLELQLEHLSLSKLTFFSFQNWLYLFLLGHQSYNRSVSAVLQKEEIEVIKKKLTNYLKSVHNLF